MRKFAFLILLGAGFLTACGMLTRRGIAPGVRFGNRVFSSNGERIYLTATNERGEFIPYSGGPGSGGMMMGANLTCASCHGADGRGGTHTMHMQVMDAPDIRYAALSGDEDGHADDGHGDGHAAYSLIDFRHAVVEGRHPDGEPLSRDMPRWQLSDEDLADLYEHIQTLN